MRIAEYFSEQNISALFFINPEITENANKEDYIKKHCQEKLHIKELGFMNWDDITSVLKNGHEIGNHTLSHERLSDISKDMYANQIALSKERIEKYAPPVQHFAWTYGLKKDISPEAFESILNCGHKSVASAIRGQHFHQLDLEKNYILRDQVVFKEPISYFNYFYRISRKKSV